MQQISADVNIPLTETALFTDTVVIAIIVHISIIFSLTDEQAMIDKKHAVQNIAVTETMTLSLFSLIISYLLALSSLFGHTS